MKNTENHNDPKLNITGVSDADLKRNAFKTPEDYFDNLTPRIMESVRNSDKTSLAVGFEWIRLLVPSLGIASIAFATWFLLNPAENSSPDIDTVLASLTLEELTQYADLQPAELVSYELVDYDYLQPESTNLSEDEILEYLSEDDIELNTIINQIDI